jgi:hypothetical protein
VSIPFLICKIQDIWLQNRCKRAKNEKRVFSSLFFYKAKGFTKIMWKRNQPPRSLDNTRIYTGLFQQQPEENGFVVWGLSLL